MKDCVQTLLELVHHAVISHPELRPALQQILPSNPISKHQYADARTLSKADGNNFTERFREIVSDPLNLLIRRVPEAGYVDENGCVTLHNGNRTPLAGNLAYYSDFSQILVINRGVHEPLEEFCFQNTIEKLKSKNAPVTMVELGAYWAHYSMWLMREVTQARCVMVEPVNENLACGKNNFEINGFAGEWINDFVGHSGFRLDQYLEERKLSSLTILHSDIQGYELEMINGAKDSLINKLVDYIFISTHSQDIHTSIVEELNRFGYRVEVSSDFENHTTSCDGFVMASSPRVPEVFTSFRPLGRREIAMKHPSALVNFVNSLLPRLIPG